VAALEGGAVALSFSSGMAAATAAIRAICRPGDHIIAPRVGYYNLRGWLERFTARWRVALDLVDTTDPAAIRAVMRPGSTRLIWIETPANPTWAITDITACAEIAHRVGALLAVDSTCATPVHTRPLTLGADLVMHSATKYLSGHSDVLAGMLVGKAEDEVWAAIHELRHDEGACLGPLESYLLLRGLRTLFVRVERASQTAQRLAERLAFLPHVEVLYPGLTSHPQHALAARQMKAFGGMVSFELHGGTPAANAFATATELFTLAESLGGVESLVEVPASMTHASIPAEERRKAGLSDGLVR
jgi:cystathionine gamma-synthase